MTLSVRMVMALADAELAKNHRGLERTRAGTKTCCRSTAKWDTLAR